MADRDTFTESFSAALQDIHIGILRKIVEERRDDLFELRLLKKDVLSYLLQLHLDIEEIRYLPKTSPGFLSFKEKKFDYAYAEVYVLTKTLNYLIGLAKAMLDETKDALKKLVVYDHVLEYWDMYDSYEDRSDGNIFEKYEK